MTTKDALHDWYSLQDALRACSEDEAQDILDAETKGKGRERFMKRVHSRLNRLRAERERLELRDAATERISL
jgi:hypothetical protein